MFSPDTKILVVDDMGTMRKIVMKCLRECGFSNFVEQPDGLQAWNALREASPPFGLVISDWNMPNCSGLDLLKKVRADATLVKMPFVLVTAEAEAAQVVQATAARVDGYIIKPFTSDMLRAKLVEIHAKLFGKAA